MTDIDRIMHLIDWNRNPEEQQEGISLAREIVNIKAFFQPATLEYSKSVWDNCAEIISARSDEELIPHLTDMILWLEDLNWPGALRIQQRLIEFKNVSVLAILLDSYVPDLEKLEKTSWLQFIADLLGNQELSQTIKNSTKEILTKYLINL